MDVACELNARVLERSGGVPQENFVIYPVRDRQSEPKYLSKLESGAHKQTTTSVPRPALHRYYIYTDIIDPGWVIIPRLHPLFRLGVEPGNGGTSFPLAILCRGVYTHA